MDMQDMMTQCKDFHHWMPFAALFAKQTVPENRPMTTRLVEQALVALLAGGGGTFATYNVMLQQQQVAQATQAEQIKALKEQIKALKEQVIASEVRLTAQIVELRQRQLK